MRRNLFMGLLTIGLLFLSSVAVGLSPGSPAYAGSCTQQTGVSVFDPNTGWSWTTRWWCGNRGGAGMYGDANYYTKTAIMDTTWSWFVCYRRGAYHAGGNNVWYYSLGDRTVSPFVNRKAWGYMPAVDVWTSTDPWPGMAQCPVGNSPPTRVDGMNKPVYFVHGYTTSGDAWNCNGWYWDDAIYDYRNDGTPAKLSGTLGRSWTFGYYTQNYQGGWCDLLSLGDRNRSIKEIGRKLAWEIYDHFSRFGDSVDAVGHSMGGLVIRAAITGVQRQESGWPPYLYVEDVTTLATPHRGAPFANACGFTQCVEMRPGSSFLGWLFDNPQSAQGTDWTLIGFDDDLVVPVWSAVPTGSSSMPVGHKIIYPDGQFPVVDAHMLPLWRTSGTYTIRYCDYFSSGCNMANRETFYQLSGSYDPIRMARYGNYYYYWW